jgi:hypothetical protein
MIKQLRNFGKSDFLPVIAAGCNLDRFFRCTTMSVRSWVGPDSPTAKLFRIFSSVVSSRAFHLQFIMIGKELRAGSM